MPPPRVLPALLLLLLFVTAPLLHCSATVSNSSNIATRTVAATAAYTNRATPTIVGCFPGIVFYDTNKNYRCSVNNIGSLEGTNLCTVHTTQQNSPCVWGVSVSNNFVTFRSNNLWGASGRFSLAIASTRGTTVTVQTNFISILFWRFAETTSLLSAPNPYYGLTMRMSTNFPSDAAISSVTLAHPDLECPDTIALCTQSSTCYDATNMRLPPPGTYRLCVAGRGWNDYLLPWGTARVEVRVLVATPLTLSNGVVPVIRLQDDGTGEVFQPGNLKMYLVRCATGTCPSVTPEKKDPMVAVGACDGTTANRVEISSNALNTPAGTYALCVEDEDGRLSPAALPITVPRDPFTMEVSGASTGSVNLRVGGGDFATRTETYFVCIAGSGVLCSTAALDASRCTESSSPSAETVDVDVRNFAEDERITFCLVTRKVAYHDHTYMDVSVVRTHVLENGGGGDEEMPLLLLVLIALLGALVVGSVILAVCCWRCRKASADEGLYEEDWNSKRGMSLSSRAFADSIVSAGQGSVYGGQMQSMYIPSAPSSSHLLRADSQGEMQRGTHYGSWMQQ